MKSDRVLRELAENQGLVVLDPRDLEDIDRLRDAIRAVGFWQPNDLEVCQVLSWLRRPDM